MFINSILYVGDHLLIIAVVVFIVDIVSSYDLWHPHDIVYICWQLGRFRGWFPWFITQILMKLKNQVPAT